MHGNLIEVVCENSECEDFGVVINRTAGPAAEVEATLEAWGQGAEDAADYCPKCKELGVAHEDGETTGPLDR